MNVLLLAALFAQDALVTTDWVAQRTDDPKVRILDVSVDPGVYEKGHVKGAVGVKWHSELADPVRRDIVSREAFAKHCSRWGIARETTVVLYGDNNNWFAAWGYWVFATYGHPSIRLMDGGRVKWELEKRPWDLTVPAPAATTYAVDAADAKLRARLAEVSTAVEKGSAVLVDVRNYDGSWTEYGNAVGLPIENEAGTIWTGK